MEVAALLSFMLLALLAVCEVHAAPRILQENYPVNSENNRPSKDVLTAMRSALASSSGIHKVHQDKNMVTIGPFILEEINSLQQGQTDSEPSPTPGKPRT